MVTFDPLDQGCNERQTWGYIPYPIVNYEPEYGGRTLSSVQGQLAFTSRLIRLGNYLTTGLMALLTTGVRPARQPGSEVSRPVRGGYYVP